MLIKFKVSNFKCFEEDFVLDFSSSNGYTFNTECIKNSNVNCAVIYGYNGAGKSNLGLAIFDLIEHLTDKKRNEKLYNNYINAYSQTNIARFSYEFLINGIIVKYEYEKSDYKTIVSEHLWIDSNKVVAFDRRNGNNQFEVNLKGVNTLNNIINDNQLSVLKYIRNNSVLDNNPVNEAFLGLFNFAEHMLFFRSLEDRTFLGGNYESKRITDEIIEKDKVQDFEKFLNDANIKCKLCVVDVLDKKELAFDFGKKRILFTEIISTGTSSLMLFYFWYLQILNSEVSMVFIDEFDAFYHHDLSRLIINKLKESGIQFIVTTHNTSIMSNDLMRPDCYFLMNKKRILPLSKCTDRELREAHNIEKIYKANGFNIE